MFVFDGLDHITRRRSRGASRRPRRRVPVAHAAAAPPPAAPGTAPRRRWPRPGAVSPLPVQPRRLRHPARHAAVRGDRVRARRDRAAVAPAAATAARRLARAADRLGSGVRGRDLADHRLRAVQLHRAPSRAIWRRSRPRSRSRSAARSRSGARARATCSASTSCSRRSRSRCSRARPRPPAASTAISRSRSARCSRSRSSPTCARLRAQRRTRRWPRWYAVELTVLGMLAALLAFPGARRAADPRPQRRAGRRGVAGALDRRSDRALPAAPPGRGRATSWSRRRRRSPRRSSSTTHDRCCC